MSSLPDGATDVVAFLFTDIESSTRLWEQDPEGMSRALAAHDALARRAVASCRGRVVKMTGDGMHAAFHDAADAVAATVDLQRAMAHAAATGGIALQLRCGLHMGRVELRDGDYFGSAVNRAARIMSVAHGGQVLLSRAVAEHAGNHLPPAVTLLDLGRVRLKDLSTPEHVYQVIHPELRERFPALRSLEAIPNNLPEQLTSFVGRREVLAEVQRLLAAARLLTLTGSGGCGKTRVSLQVAAESLEKFPDGAWLTELARVSEPGLVAPTLAMVLGLKEEPGKPIVDTLTGHLRDKRVLLLLDNCEHLLDACAHLAGTLLRQCPGVTILASSREALGIGGEQAYRVPSLELPGAGERQAGASAATCEAAQLFIERALLVRADFEVSQRNEARLASICRRLDGIPLAIELAAARTRSLSVEEIEAKLDQRFRLLTGGSRTALPRQQTLRSLIDWSYDLLNDPEKALLQRLSVFAGSWTLEAAEHVCTGDGVAAAHVLDRLTSLDDKSLVATEQREGRTRYRMLETMRQYAREKLVESGDGEATRKRHCDYFVALAEEAEPKLFGDEQAEWLQRLADEHDNVRAALTWAVDSPEPETGLRLCTALQRFWSTRGYFSEGRAWCARALAALPAVQHALARGRVLGAAGTLAFYQADYPAARLLYQEELEMWRQLGERRRVAAALGNLGNVVHEEGDTAAARALFEECLTVMRELQDARGIAGALNSLGNVANQRSEFAAARKLYEECLAIAQSLGDQGGLGIVLHNLGVVAYAQDDLDAAWTLLERSLAVRRQLGDRWGTASSLNNLGEVACAQGDHAAAATLFHEALAISRAVADRRMIAYSLEGCGAVAAALGDPARAASIWAAARRLREEIGWPVPANERSRHDRRIAVARAAAGDTGFDEAWEKGRALALEQVVDLALANGRDAAAGMADPALAKLVAG